MNLTKDATVRIEAVDALRGLAVFAIMLLHNIEHFDFYYFPETFPAWQKYLDTKIWDALFFLFAGKAYAIFALLFGFSFYIQLNNQEKLGIDFRVRFLWRLFLLLIIGIFNSMFYQGDILSFYAVVGISLIIVSKWSNRAVLFTAILLMLQPFEWSKIIYILNNPSYITPEFPSNYYFIKSNEYLGGKSFLELIKGNLTNGKMAVIHWTWENGRFFQASSLFMLGMLIGRQNYFTNSPTNTTFWKTILYISIPLFILLYTLIKFLPDMLIRETLWKAITIPLTSWTNFLFTMVIVSSFVLTYQYNIIRAILKYLVPFGKMSLTNYILQSIVGSFIYYEYGLGWYKYTGASHCLVIGLFLFSIQLIFCHIWLKYYQQGPFEYLWSKATWMFHSK